MLNPVKAQSAMEYLMTYGWAILIIAVVLGVLFQLGIFGAGRFAPHASPGSCQVVREGTGLTQTIALEGECSGYLPQYVLQENGNIVGVSVPSSPTLFIYTSSITQSAWVNPASLGIGTANNQLSMIDFKTTQYEMCLDSNTFWISDANGDWVTTPYTFNANTWYDVVGVLNYTTKNVIFYVNGKQTGVQVTDSAWGPGHSNAATQPFEIGADRTGSTFCFTGVDFNGQISNVQIYNSTLSPAEISAMYIEGIGGAPVRLQNLVGWWPLNGDTNDYSGLGNEGTGFGSLDYSGTWGNGYTIP